MEIKLCLKKIFHPLEFQETTFIKLPSLLVEIDLMGYVETGCGTGLTGRKSFKSPA